MEQLTKHSSQFYEAINAKCCCFNMRKVMRAVTQFFDRYLEPADIRSTQFTLLVALSSINAKTLTEIAENLVMDRTTLTRNLKPLEKLELITTIQPLDKRSKVYVLTDKGKGVVEKAVPLWEEAQHSVVNTLGVERYNNIVKELESVLKAIDPTGFKKS
jgi:DNA-binding MarR family transcriptional regulator